MLVGVSPHQLNGTNSVGGGNVQNEQKSATGIGRFFQEIGRNIAGKINPNKHTVGYLERKLKKAEGELEKARAKSEKLRKNLKHSQLEGANENEKMSQAKFNIAQAELKVARGELNAEAELSLAQAELKVLLAEKALRKGEIDAKEKLDVAKAELEVAESKVRYYAAGKPSFSDLSTKLENAYQNLEKTQDAINSERASKALRAALKGEKESFDAAKDRLEDVIWHVFGKERKQQIDSAIEEYGKAKEKLSKALKGRDDVYAQKLMEKIEDQYESDLKYYRSLISE